MLLKVENAFRQETPPKSNEMMNMRDCCISSFSSKNVFIDQVIHLSRSALAAYPEETTFSWGFEIIGPG